MCKDSVITENSSFRLITPLILVKMPDFLRSVERCTKEISEQTVRNRLRIEP